MQRSVVVLPQPLGPSSTMNSPSAISRLTPFTAPTPPYFFTRLRIETPDIRYAPDRGPAARHDLVGPGARQRARPQLARRLLETPRDAGDGELAPFLRVECRDHLVFEIVTVVTEFVEAGEQRGRNLGALQAVEPEARGGLREDLLQDRDQHVAVLHAVGIAREARVVGELGTFDRLAQSAATRGASSP